MLRRLGKKTRLLPKLLPLFPHKVSTFIDLFMGTGAVSFSMVDRSKYIIANDRDAEVFNLFMVIKNRKDELIESIIKMPVHETLFKHWKDSWEHDQIWRAVRFLFLSNFGFLGKAQTMRCSPGNDKKILLQRIDVFSPLLEQIKFVRCDFRDVLKKVGRINNKEHVFLYADPPYLGTANNYAHSFTEEDTRELFDLLAGSGYKFAISEFDTPFILNLANTYGLNVSILGERKNLKNRRIEILVTNYQINCADKAA